ncbi:MAG: hypothetical protein ACTHNP_06405 [Solirubrobacterales bacterium]
MDAIGYVAVYAAVVSTADLLWRILGTRRSRSSHVTVTVRPEPVPAEGGELKLTVVVRNAGERTEAIEAVGLTFIDESATEMNESAVRKAVDESLLPNHNYRWTWDLGEQRFAVGRRYTGWVQLATGEVVESEPAHFGPYSLAIAGLGDAVRPRLGEVESDARPSDLPS